MHGLGVGLETCRGRQPPDLTHEAKASIRSWLPLQASVPPPSPALFNWSSPDFSSAVQQFEHRVESMWFPTLPGISPWDIAENYAEYLGFRAIEKWAKTLSGVTV